MAGRKNKETEAAEYVMSMKAYDVQVVFIFPVPPMNICVIAASELQVNIKAKARYKSATEILILNNPKPVLI